MPLDNAKRRRAVIVGIALVIAAAHVFHPGIYVTGAAHRFYFSYFSDVTIPFSLYFLLIQTEATILNRWQVRCIVAFLVPAACETLQYLGIPALGSVFDAWDYVAYALGVLAAALVDRQVFSRIFEFWRKDSKPAP